MSTYLSLLSPQMPGNGRICVSGNKWMDVCVGVYVCAWDSIQNRTGWKQDRNYEESLNGEKIDGTKLKHKIVVQSAHRGGALAQRKQLKSFWREWWWPRGSEEQEGGLRTVREWSAKILARSLTVPRKKRKHLPLLGAFQSQGKSKAIFRYSRTQITHGLSYLSPYKKDLLDYGL